jgi:DNA-3-methyladenine glycosylase I
MTGSSKYLRLDENGVARCWWCADQLDYIAYHDNEWGQPSADDQRLFEKVCLEGFQAGLSWLTILRKRARFRAVFRDFDFHAVARFNKSSISRLLKDAGIIRHRGKIESTINNARHAIELVEEMGSLAGFVWQFEPDESSEFDGCRATTDESTMLSKELKSRGWSFVGPTTAYAFMQSVGMVNDHIPGCQNYETTSSARSQFDRPSLD